VAQLRDLGALHDSGALSDDEFAAAKAKLLASDR
jgi:Short C-terminal domain